MKSPTLEGTVSEYFENVTRHSWTWNRLTEDEKYRFLSIDFSCVKGTAKQRQETYFTIYSAFLYGCGYNHAGWREPATA